MTKVHITGYGFVTKHGTELPGLMSAVENPPRRTSIQDYSLEGFDALPLLSNKRVSRSVSWYQAFSLGAVELCKKDAKIDGSSIVDQRFGMYVGAPPSSMFDNNNYVQPVKDSKQPDGAYSEGVFGATCADTLGTTLLLGLPNNVLCYGSMILNAKGPNSNYVSGDVSGLLALCNGAWKISDGRLDGAVVGAYSMSSDHVIVNMLDKQGLLKKSNSEPYQIKLDQLAGTIPADGSVFMMLESSELHKNRQSSILATFLGAGTSNSNGLRYLRSLESSDSDKDAVLRTVLQCVKQSNIRLEEVGLVFLSGTGVSYVDESEVAAIEELIKSSAMDCSVLSLAPAVGNLMECGGLLEPLVAHKIYAGEITPSEVLYYKKLEARPSSDKKYVLVLRTSLSGDSVCAAFEVGGSRL